MTEPSATEPSATESRADHVAAHRPEPMSTQREAMGAFSDSLGLQITEASGTRMVARWHLGPQLHQPHAIVHGGAHAAVVETLASMGANLALDGDGVCVGVNNNTDFYRAVTDGVLDVVATPVHQGRSQQVWQVEIRDDTGRLVARGALRVHNLPARRA